MRIRQVRPEFFSDPVVARLSPDVRLTYIGLWCVADDAGWLIWDEQHIGALLSPYESIRARENRVARAGLALGDTGRLVFFKCGCALVPKLEEHQRIGGNKSFTVRDKHRVHTSTDKSVSKSGSNHPHPPYESPESEEVHTSTDKSARNVTVGNGSNGIAGPASADALSRLRDEEDAAEIARVRERRGLRVTA